MTRDFHTFHTFSYDRYGKVGRSVFDFKPSYTGPKAS
jgi:hypothetical protein